MVSTSPPGRQASVLVWFAFVALCNGVGFASAMIGTNPSVYQELVRPSWAPPPGVFAPAWITLYWLMGTAAFLIWRRCQGTSRRKALTLFGIQLAVNFAWTPVFFGLRQYGLAIFVIVAYWFLVIAMLIAFLRRMRLAGLLIIPLLAWVTFATALNIAVWWLNR